mmetsp:Transcript_15451/g.45646  ORF Transcript_15451/g.45646 Transcript_15451/m.45646 type:complete len:249 (-) Transcript_15451:10-756(-)
MRVLRGPDKGRCRAFCGRNCGRWLQRDVDRLLDICGPPVVRQGSKVSCQRRVAVPGQGVLLAAGAEGGVVAARGRLIWPGLYIVSNGRERDPAQRYRHDRHYIGEEDTERMEQIAVGSYFRSIAQREGIRRLGRDGAGFEKEPGGRRAAGRHAAPGGVIGPPPAPDAARRARRHERRRRAVSSKTARAEAARAAGEARALLPAAAAHAREADQVEALGLHRGRDADHGHRHAGAYCQGARLPGFHPHP